MSQATVGFQNKNVFAVKTLNEFLINKGFKIVTIVFDSNRGDGFVVVNKDVSNKLRSEILNWNYGELSHAQVDKPG